MYKTTVLGGGIAGLSAAYYLQQLSVGGTITVYEAKKRLGGWIRTENLPEQRIRFESGPRTIRPVGPKGRNTLQLIERLGLSDAIVSVNRKHASAKNRMIYVNKELCSLPSSAGGLFTTRPPFKRPLIFSILGDLLVGRTPPRSDESIYDFIKRRFGHEMADYLISPMICGICAGDAHEISVKFLMEDLFRQEQRHGSVLRGLVASMFDRKRKAADVAALKETQSMLGDRAAAERWSVYSFKDGLEMLPKTIAAHLVANSVNVQAACRCNALRFESDNTVTMKVNGEWQQPQQHVMAALQSFQLADLVAEQHPQLADELVAIPYVDVAVVNLHYADADWLRPPAFGFLVPPAEKLPILGVIYDSCCFDMAAGQTVVTVMMGGAWFKSNFGANPSHKELRDIAARHVGDILRIPSAPTTARVAVLEKCIPQYVVGHHDRVQRIREYVRRNKLPLSLCGSAYDGVGVNDVIFSAKKCVQAMAEK